MPNIGLNEFRAALRNVLRKLDNASGVDELPDSLQAALGKWGATAAGTVQDRAISLDRLYSKVWALIEWDEWLTQIIVDEGGQMTAIIYDDEANLYARAVTITGDTVTLGERIRIMEAYQVIPDVDSDAESAERAGRVRTSVSVVRQANGTYRWFSVACTSVLNRSFEIDSRELFDTFEQRFNAGDRPFYLTIRHVGELFYLGAGDWVKRDGDLLLTSGTFDPNPNNVLARAAESSIERDSDYWGISIGYGLEADDPPPEIERVVVQTEAGSLELPIPIYKRGTLVECSILAESECAALFTSVSRTEVIRTMPNTRTRNLQTDLETLFPDNPDMVQELLAKAEGTQRSIDGNPAIIRRDGSAADATADPPEDQDELILEMDDETTAAIVGAVLAHPDFAAAIAGGSDGESAADELRSRVDSLESELTQLRETNSAALSVLEELGLMVGRDDEAGDAAGGRRRKVSVRGTNRPRQLRNPDALGDDEGADDEGVDDTARRNANAELLAERLKATRK